MDHWALLMIMDPEEPQLLQATSLSSISWRTHHACSPEAYMPADYWYCSCAADPPAPRSPAPASWPPEPEEPARAGAEEKGAAARGSGSDTLGFDAGGSDAEGAEADPDAEGADAEGADAAADAEAGTDAPPARPAEGVPEPVPFPTPSVRVPPTPSGAPRVPPSWLPSVVLTAPTALTLSGVRERSQPSAPSRATNAIRATSPAPMDLLPRGLLRREPGRAPPSVFAGSGAAATAGLRTVSEYPAAAAKARGRPSSERRKSPTSSAALPYLFSGFLANNPIARASIPSGTKGLRFLGGSGCSMTCFMAVASGPSASKGTAPVSIS